MLQSKYFSGFGVVRESETCFNEQFRDEEVHEIDKLSSAFGMFFIYFCLAKYLDTVWKILVNVSKLNSKNNYGHNIALITKTLLDVKCSEI